MSRILLGMCGGDTCVCGMTLGMCGERHWVDFVSFSCTGEKLTWVGYDSIPGIYYIVHVYMYVCVWGEG